MSGPISLVQPWAPPHELPPGYDRHEPSDSAVRTAVQSLVADVAWADLSWSELIERLLRLGRTDIPLSRLAEGHIDAVRILDQAGRTPEPGAMYGVWASRSQRTGLRAERADGDLVVSGTLRFASGAGVLDRALVPVWPDAEHHLLLDVAVRHWPVDTSRWRSGAMRVSRTHEITLDDEVVPVAAQVGSDDFYLTRPGFFPGGVGVAACWLGGAARVLDVVRAVTNPGQPAQRRRFGLIRTELVAAAATLRSTANLLDRLWADSDARDGVDLHQIATEARAVVATAVRRILDEAKAVTGPTGLALDDDVAHAVPDLEMYVGQQNADADAGLLGDPERQP